MEAEISPSGDVLVEGHLVGRLEGFRFSADTAAENNVDAKAGREAAQKALAPEYEARATRFAAAPNGDLAIATDGTVRWIGQPVASLAAGEDLLRPRAVLLADEQLAGAARDKVAERIERFVAFPFETVLKPLFDLGKAETLSNIVRGIAFRLVENLGILARRDVAEEIKSLDQEARAALRQLGVRFGAYHIFIPLLLKPAPAQAITLLWALKNDARGEAGYGDVVQALAAGRTSVVVDPAFNSEFYRLAGYRVLAQRAVRVDILERLADLIRPALSWKPESGEPRPDGAYDGRHFIITPAMLSIMGATMQDMEEVLKRLGYRSQLSDSIAVTEKPAADTPDTTAAKGKKAVPAAEPVGALFAHRIDPETLPAAEPIGASFAHLSDPKTLPVAEPVGFAGTAESTDTDTVPDKPVLLWCYQARQNASHTRKPRRSAHNRNAKAPQGKRNLQDTRAENQGRHRPNKKHHSNRPFERKHTNKRPEKPIDPDSPFGKLASLLEKMKK
ncbi:MAG: Putative ATP-dependent helicase [Candidatus Tokpelaia hoelldobleri]|uniref:ATP-dependent helicase n=1 Tax=Candidatus Tokpelaia hoelldobleri TaxID=1902579 RepID=A0A1U9JSI8_9HYPH|nr:MAG: Putative ATP-dependent helicase [Candidatus Tokpelaia hoelldoblerii]